MKARNSEVEFLRDILELAEESDRIPAKKALERKDMDKATDFVSKKKTGEAITLFKEAGK
jgi:hypothetical protein